MDAARECERARPHQQATTHGLREVAGPKARCTRAHALHHNCQMASDEGIDIREAQERDVPGIHHIFSSVYGDDYPYRRFLDDAWLKRSVFNDDVVTIVAERRADGRLLGTASVVTDIGAQSDLIAEFGRLAVLPEGKSKGIGSALMAMRLELCRDRLHAALVENRTLHNRSQRISRAAGFVPVGLLPAKHQFRNRESMALYATHFGDALSLRRNHPRIVPEAHDLAFRVLSNHGLNFDAIVDEGAQSYVGETDYQVEELTSDAYAPLLRIERGRTQQREVFGPMRLHYGFFKLATRHAEYLVARRSSKQTAGAIVGAIGFVRDDVDRSLRIFELIALEDGVVPALVDALLARVGGWNTAYVEIDVSAHAPRLQRTLIERAFVPAAYVPAMVFHDVERLDVVRLVRLFERPDFSQLELLPAAAHVAESVIARVNEQFVLPEVSSALTALPVLDGLNDEQVRRVAANCQVVHADAREVLFRPGDAADCLYVVLSGSVSISRSCDPWCELGSVDAGDALGESSMLTQTPRSVAARTTSETTLARLTQDTLAELARSRPDIAVVLYRNLTIGLGKKLRQSNSSPSYPSD